MVEGAACPESRAMLRSPGQALGPSTTTPLCPRTERCSTCPMAAGLRRGAGGVKGADGRAGARRWGVVQLAEPPAARWQSAPGWSGGMSRSSKHSCALTKGSRLSTISKFWPSRLLKYSSILPLMMPSGCASVLCLPGVRGAGGERSSKGGGKTDLAGVNNRDLIESCCAVRPNLLAFHQPRL